jgi:hypothetical protein
VNAAQPDPVELIDRLFELADIGWMGVLKRLVHRQAVMGPV